MARLDERQLLEIGERITDARRAIGLTQAALAEHLGLPLGVVDTFELGRADASKHIQKIAEVTGRSTQWLLTGSEPSSTGDSMLVLLGERVRDARQAAGLSESELAQRLGLVEGEVAEFEAGAKDASTLLERIAEATGRPSEWFRDEGEAMSKAETSGEAIAAPVAENPRTSSTGSSARSHVSVTSSGGDRSSRIDEPRSSILVRPISTSSTVSSGRPERPSNRSGSNACGSSKTFSAGRSSWRRRSPSERQPCGASLRLSPRHPSARTPPRSSPSSLEQSDGRGQFAPFAFRSEHDERRIIVTRLVEDRAPVERQPRMAAHVSL